MNVEVVPCVLCPVDNEFIRVKDCTKCPYWRARLGNTVKCLYEAPEAIPAEKAKDAEFKSRW